MASQVSQSSTQQVSTTFAMSVKETPGHLFEQLEALAEWANDRNPPAVKLCNEFDRNNCMVVLRNFYEHVIQSFPLPQEYPWVTIYEKIKLIEASFDVFPLVGAAFCAEHDFSDFSKRFFLRVFRICHVLDAWIDVPGVSAQDGYPTPRDLYEKGVQACIGLLRAWFESVKTEKSGLRGWQVAKEMTTELLALCQDLLLGGVMDGTTHIYLFSTPRLRQEAPDFQAPPADIVLNDKMSLLLLITSSLRIILESISPTVLSSWFLTDTLRTTADCATQTYHAITSSLFATADAKRSRAISRLTVVMATSLQSYPTYYASADSMRLLLLLSRLHEGPKDCWAKEEAALLKAFSVPISGAPSRADVEFILQALVNEQWDERGDGIRAIAVSYLRAATAHLDLDLLIAIRDTLSHGDYPTYYDDLTQVIQRKIASLRSNMGTTGASQGSSATEGRRWREGVQSVVQAIIEPDEVAWMDDDDSLSDVQYISRALGEVEGRFARSPISNRTAHARVALARELGRLPCALTRHLDSPCPSTPTRTSVASIPTGMRVVVALLDGNEKEVTAPVHRAVYDALLRIIRHHTSGFGQAMIEPVSELVIKGMKNSDRGVRLSAGRCLAELIKMYQDKGQQGAQYIEFMFTNLDVMLSRFTDRFKETVLVTAGLIAKRANPDTLYRGLLCLVSQLGNNNPVLKGTAFMQLASVVDSHGKSRYSLLHPYMERLAIFIVDRMHNHSALLTEYCSFLGASRADFFTATMDAIIPHLFATCNGPALELIATELSCDVASLFWKRPAKILAHAHMVSIPGHRQKSLNFILSYFKTPGGQFLASEHELIVSSLVDLVSELVMNLGDEDPTIVQAALHGLMKVEDTVKNKRVQTQPRLPGQTLGAFLEDHILGVITHMIEILEDVKEKRTLKEKMCVCRAVGKIVAEIGPSVSSIAPQIMAMLQTMLAMPDLRDMTLQSWSMFLRVLDVEDVGSYVGPTGAAFVTAWPTLSLSSREVVKDCLRYLVFEQGEQLRTKLNELPDVTSIPELSNIGRRLSALRENWTPEKTLQVLLERIANENLNVVSRALEELRAFLSTDDESFVRGLTSGDVFHHSVSNIVSVLLAASCRDGEDSDAVRILAFDCIGVLGAADPYRFETDSTRGRMIVVDNFSAEEETAVFALHLIRDVLVGVYQSTSDVQYQRHLAYALQELLRLCGFNTSVVTRGSSTSMKARNRWSTLSKSVVEAVTPLLKSRYILHTKDLEPTERPIYHEQSTYREWIQMWMTYLIPEATGTNARKVFGVFPLVVKNRDVGVARRLLPHIVLNVLISGTDKAVGDIFQEILAVLQDQVDPSSPSSTDKKELSAQTIFMVLDHLNGWVRIVRRSLSKNSDNRNRVSSEAQEQLTRVDSILTNIDGTLMAKAAFQCKAYARALMCFEQQIRHSRDLKGQEATLQEYYERLHEIYAQLDEPDGMEGASTLILSPSLEHQIRQHESTGRWTSAQSCWEVNLQHDPNDLQSHLGLLRCLRNLGHYDTMRTHVEGILTRYPAWKSELIGYQVESGYMVGDWDKVQGLVDQTENEAPSILIARILLAMREGDEAAILDQLTHARKILGAPIAAVDTNGYIRCYDAVLNLHLVHELEIIYRATMVERGDDMEDRLSNLQQRLSARLGATLPSFRVREPILSIRRTAFELSLKKAHSPSLSSAIGHSWLLSAKLARKAGYWHTAYSAVLQAQHGTPVFTVIESAKLAKASGEPLRAIQELDSYYNVMKGIDIEEGDVRVLQRGKVFLLRARWMSESDRYEGGSLVTFYQEANHPKEWEGGSFYWGQFQDKCFKELGNADYDTRGVFMNCTTIKCYAKSIALGSKHIYESVPRLLTLWLDMCARSYPAGTKAEGFVEKTYARVLTSFQASAKYKASHYCRVAMKILSRITHKNPRVWEVLCEMIQALLEEYPMQGLWLFMPVLNSKDTERSKRGFAVLDGVRKPKDKKRSKVDVKLIEHSIQLGMELINLCDKSRAPVMKNGKPIQPQPPPEPFVMSVDFPKLVRLVPSKMLIPLQEYLVANLPPSSADTATYKPFLVNAPTIRGFAEEIELMTSLAQPKKFVIFGSDGRKYRFLAKPKDDLRKDARLMDLDAMINKFLKSDSDSRRRRLHIRTYGVLPLNETSGLIQWVPNSIPLRAVLLDIYKARKVPSFGNEAARLNLERIAAMHDKEAAQAFEEEFMSRVPPVFHEWFIKTFPEPSAWLAGRLAYTRTAAVMSMVGYILGLGDRHCENILLDMNNGDVVHIDFNCLFEKGHTLTIPDASSRSA
ncbi:hypothetical protein NM688_g1817 [Phlebia brevispora]|uniref:Uncharacterized protein n=1 Tax=Phlebia brevispora TaxID=194682 RepID=A0ACC1TA91_9APHY|nr:hypothetical protein NM688_g1817 [Phlebia brevispora]